MTRTLDRGRVTDDVEPPMRAAPRGWLRPVLLAVIAVALVALGGGGAVLLGLGRPATPSTDSVDAGFAYDMSRHHLQGVEMADLAQGRSTDPLVLSLAFDISHTQQNQVGRMQGWLDLWGLPQSTSRSPMAWMGGMPGSAMAGMDMSGSAEPGALMPGMATDAEMAQLRGLSGTAWDVDFLRLMIRHHEGGLPMARYAVAHAQEDSVRTLASSMVETQTAEVQTMLQMLTAKGGTPLPAPAG